MLNSKNDAANPETLKLQNRSRYIEMQDIVFQVKSLEWSVHCELLAP